MVDRARDLEFKPNDIQHCLTKLGELPENGTFANQRDGLFYTVEAIKREIQKGGDVGIDFLDMFLTGVMKFEDVYINVFDDEDLVARCVADLQSRGDEGLIIVNGVPCEPGVIIDSIATRSDVGRIRLEDFRLHEEALFPKLLVEKFLAHIDTLLARNSYYVTEVSVWRDDRWMMEAFRRESVEAELRNKTQAGAQMLAEFATMDLRDEVVEFLQVAIVDKLRMAVAWCFGPNPDKWGLRKLQDEGRLKR